ncbi:MAG TPA: bacillithiol biosynthesis deacetylase BshB1 [Bacteroidota bacterium]|nr:bacillithiol biosynthesis deacetylase BshB1 [Bacteroidota bacterium]
MSLDLLAIGAHPDDVELTCGGTLAKCVRLGYRGGIVDLTRGELGTRGTPKGREIEGKEAAKILGLAVRENLAIPDGDIQINKRNLLKLVTVIRKHRPRLLLIPHSIERHPDHVHAHHLAKEAWFYAGLTKMRTTSGGKSQEPWRPEKYFEYMQWFEFIPSFIVDISDVFEIRMDAVRAHRSQFYDPASKEPQTLLSQKSFLDFVETRSKAYGSKIGVKYGEPFYTVDAIGTNDPFSLKMFKG